MTDEQTVWLHTYASALGGALSAGAAAGYAAEQASAEADEAVRLFETRFPAKPNRPPATAPLGPPLG